MLTIKESVIVIRGGGDLATGVAHRLCRSGFKVLVLEVPQPLVVRRTVSFAQAVIDGETTVEEVVLVDPLLLRSALTSALRDSIVADDTELKELTLVPVFVLEVVVWVVVVFDELPKSSEYFLFETGPKYPLAGEIPLAACQIDRAFFVRSPKRLVSLPGEPIPSEAMVKPAELRYFCKHLTSSPLAPPSRSLEKSHSTEAKLVVGISIIAQKTEMNILIREKLILFFILLNNYKF